MASKPKRKVERTFNITRNTSVTISVQDIKLREWVKQQHRGVEIAWPLVWKPFWVMERIEFKRKKR